MIAYHPDNVGRDTGGPQSPDWQVFNVTTQSLEEDFILDSASREFEVIKLEKNERIVNEGLYHIGKLTSVVKSIYL